jgi:hypothetical protein
MFLPGRAARLRPGNNRFSRRIDSIVVRSVSCRARR